MIKPAHTQRFINPVVVYAVVLITALLWPFALPGLLGLRDMVIVNSPALTVSNFGMGDLPARNAPQDGLLALVGTVIPAGWFVRLLIFSVACLSAYLACRCVKDGSEWHKAAAITLTLWNPFVIERFLQGHWSLVIAAWLLPSIAIMNSTRVKLALVALCSITPTGLVLACITALWTTRRRLRDFLIIIFCSAALSVPWLIPSLQHPPESFGTDVFVARAEELVGTVGALLGLGGIWNNQAVPPSRSAGFAVAGVILFVLLLRAMPRREATLAFFGLGLCLFITFGPTQWLVDTIPGLSLFRDSQKLVILMLPAMVIAAGRIRFSAMSHNAVAPLLVIILSIMQVPDAPYAMRELQPHAQSGPWTYIEGRTLNADSRGLIEFNGTVMVDPWSKTTDLVPSGELAVDGEVVDPVSSDYTQAVKAWESQDTNYLVEHGINGVISDGTYHQISEAHTPRTDEWWLGLCLNLWWIATSLVLLAIGSSRLLRTH